MRNTFMNGRDAARPVEGSRKAISMNVANGIVTHVRRRERLDICAI